MGYCLTVLVRMLASKKFIEEFLSRFTFRCYKNPIPIKRCKQYKLDYETYNVWYKYYHDPIKNVLLSTLKNKYSCLFKNINNLLINELINIILLYTEMNNGELCYLFKIWKDNFLVSYANSPNESYGAAYQIRQIIKQILNENKLIKKKQLIRISACIIERYNLMYTFGGMNDDVFKKFVLSQINDWPNHAQMEISHLPIWNTPYPLFKISLNSNIFTTVSFKENKFDNKNWNEYTNIIKKKHKIMRDDLTINVKVKISGLKNSKILNGQNGIIIDEYNFKKERWPVKVIKTSKQYLIKSKNLRVI